jgi:hypothetical protein
MATENPNVRDTLEMAKLLRTCGMFEHDGILIQPFPDGTEMQVRLSEDRTTVYSRKVSGSDEAEWSDSTGFILCEWIKTESPVWRWLQFKGVDQSKVLKKLLGLN